MSVVKNKQTGKFDVHYYYRNNNGKMKPSTKRGFVEEKNAIEFDNSMKINIAHGVNISHICFKEFANLFLKYVMENKSYGTYYSYKNKIENHILPFFEKYKLVDINGITIVKFKEYLNTYKIDGVRKSRDSNKNCILYVLRSMFTFSRESYLYKIIGSDYVSVFKKKDIRKLHVILNKEDILKILSNISNNDLYIKGLIATFFFTGCRCGEARGLQWKHIDLNRRMIYFEQSIKTKRNPAGVKFRLEMPKNDNSRRTTPMSNDLYNIIYTIYNIDSKRDGFNADSFVFGCDKYVPDTTLQRKLDYYYKKAGYGEHIPIHDLKHSCISYLSSQGITIGEIAEFVGETIEVLMRVYVHCFANAKYRTLRAFDEI